jgi:hypothetical protein
MAAATLLLEDVATICLSLSRHRARVMSTSTAFTEYEQQSQRNETYTTRYRSLYILWDLERPRRWGKPSVGRGPKLERLEVTTVGNERSKRKTQKVENRESGGVRARRVGTRHLLQPHLSRVSRYRRRVSIQYFSSPADIYSLWLQNQCPVYEPRHRKRQSEGNQSTEWECRSWAPSKVSCDRTIGDDNIVTTCNEALVCVFWFCRWNWHWFCPPAITFSALHGLGFLVYIKILGSGWHRCFHQIEVLVQLAEYVTEDFFSYENPVPFRSYSSKEKF